MTSSRKLIEDIDDIGVQSNDTDLKGTLEAWKWASRQAKRDSDYF